MAKFKVGDEVSLGRMKAKVIHIESTGDFPYLVERADNRIEFCNDAEMMLIAPAIPAGWMPADEPKHDCNHVHVLLSSGREWYGWYSPGIAWKVFLDNADPSAIKRDIGADHGMTRDAAPGEVLAWREIEPAAKARYVVCAIPTEHDTLEEAELHAQRAVESLRVNVVIARVVEEVKPGKPEIIRMEE